MEQIFISFSKSDLQDLIGGVVNACLKRNYQQSSAAPPQDELLTVPQAAEFLKLSTPTIYGLLSKGTIPSMKQGKRVYFSKQELIDWLKEGRKKSKFELDAEADQYLESLKIKRS